MHACTEWQGRVAIERKLWLRGHCKSLQKPSEANKISFTWNPSLPSKRRKGRTSGFNSQTNVYTKHHLKPKVRFFRKPPPSQTNFVCFTGLLRTFAMAPYTDRPHSTVNLHSYPRLFPCLQIPMREVKTLPGQGQLFRYCSALLASGSLGDCCGTGGKLCLWVVLFISPTVCGVWRFMWLWVMFDETNILFEYWMILAHWFCPRLDMKIKVPTSMLWDTVVEGCLHHISSFSLFFPPFQTRGGFFGLLKNLCDTFFFLVVHTCQMMAVNIVFCLFSSLSLSLSLSLFLSLFTASWLVVVLLRRKGERRRSCSSCCFWQLMKFCINLIIVTVCSIVLCS